MVPAAPDTFSTTTDFLRDERMRSAITLAIASAGPPAANGTTIVTCREGKISGSAAVAALAIPAASVAAPIRRRHRASADLSMLQSLGARRPAVKYIIPLDSYANPA